MVAVKLTGKDAMSARDRCTWDIECPTYNQKGELDLSDEQMKGIVPLINRYSQKSRLTTKDKLQMEKDCLGAMQKAGCPLVLPPVR